MRRTIYIISFLLLFFYKSALSHDSLNIIAYINNKPVEDLELKREMSRYRSEVYRSYAKQFDLANISDFWDTKLGSIRPIDSLHNKALDALRAIKIQEDLLMRYNLWPYTNYSHFLNALREENIKRRQSVESGQIIYGPIEFSEQIFFDHRLSILLIELKKKLVADGIIQVNDTVLLNHFELLKHRGVYRPNKAFNEYKQQVYDAYVEVCYQKLIAEEISKSHLRLVK